MIKRNKIPTILGVLVLLGGLFGGVILLNKAQIFRIGASPTITPKDIRVGNISDTSATVSWITEDQTTDFISYGDTQKIGTIINETQDDSKFTTHSITITGLLPSTVYYYKINSNGTTFDNGGTPWQFTTGPSISSQSQNSYTVSGSVITASGTPAKRAIVYITINGYLVSTLASDAGNYVVQLSQVRQLDLDSYANIDPTNTLLEIYIENESSDIATAKIYPQAANPVPTLVMGQDKDFRSLESSSEGQNPDANLSLPETSTGESKFNVSETDTETSKTKSVTLESVNNGETVTSDQPEFFGNGTVGQQITITVHSSEEISGTTKVSSNGSWKWSPPSNLSEGAHTIIISWIDSSGITRTITRNFIVQAGEMPAFVSTPSATPTSTPLTTKTPTPTKSPTPTPTVKATATPKITATSLETSEPLPVTGEATPTLLFMAAGLTILAFSFYTWKISSKNL